jgi:hypothetical protein
VNKTFEKKIVSRQCSITGESNALRKKTKAEKNRADYSCCSLITAPKLQLWPPNTHPQELREAPGVT